MRSALLQLFNESYPNSSPDCGFEETEKDFQISLDVPGVKREDINIEVVNNVLVITGERKGKRICSFEKKFRLGDAVATDNIQAALNDGVLTLSLAKAEKAQARRIAIAS